MDQLALGKVSRNGFLFHDYIFSKVAIRAHGEQSQRLVNFRCDSHIEKVSLEAARLKL